MVTLVPPWALPAAGLSPLTAGVAAVKVSEVRRLGQYCRR